MRNYFSVILSMIIVSICGTMVQSCQEKDEDKDEDGFSVLSLDDFKEVTIDEPQKWEGAPEDQYVSVFYAQPGQYVAYMPMDSCQFHFYDTNLKYLYSRVTEGQGPGEFLSPFYCGQWIKDTNGKIMTAVLDDDTDRIMVVSEEFTGGRDLAALPEKFGINPTFMVTDPEVKHIYGVSSYLAFDLGRGVMFRYDIETDSIHYTMPTFEITDLRLALGLMQKATSVSHDCQTIVNAYIYEPVIELLDGNLELKKAWKLKDVDIAKESYDPSTSTSFFRGVQVDDRYFYVHYYGRAYGQEGDSYVLAFEHSGKPAFKINIGNAYWFTINEATHTIIIMRYQDDGEPAAYIATLPEI